MTDLITKQNSVQYLEILNSTTADNYKYQFKTFINFLQNTGAEVSPQSLIDYFTWLNLNSGYKAKTIAVKRQAVKKRVRQLFANKPIEERIRIDQLFKDLDHDTETKAPRVNNEEVTADRILDSVEYRALILSCRSQRQQLFIKFLWVTGCRVSEMTGALIEDSEITDQVVKIRVMGKGRKERFVRIDLSLFNDIRETFQGRKYLFETSTGSPYNRSYVSGQISKIGKRIHRRISAHSLRHSFATRKVNQYPGKVDAVSRYMGHSSVSITLDMYCHNSLSNEELLDIA